MSSLCVDIGATKVLVGILDGDFKSKKRYDSRYFLDNLERESDVLKNENDIDRVLIATAGPLDRERGFIYPPNLPDEKIQILKPFENNFGDVTIMNDCHAGVVGEYEYGNVSTENLLYITLSTGIGAGAVIDGSLMKGETYNFAEVGHIKLDDVGRCGCGGTGHWEALCGGKNLPKMAKRVVNKDIDSAEELFKRYRDGDQELQHVINQILEYNVTALIDLIHVYDPGHISIGGSIGLNQFDLIVQRGIEKIKKRTLYQTPTIEKSDLGNEVVLQGLKAVWKENYDL